ncbi:MAG: fibronectin type III domain-containing protein [Desulfatitalea sp.]|nr:fibronectin type III domain-containing protein [Desulfatitalea sp.]MBI5895822.1 fibronectin type III domain-containing protein [Desulfobacterales bacterium]
MRIEIRLMFLILWIAIFNPVIGWTADVTLAWDPNTESSTVGYRLYAREDGEDYNYARPEWQGETTECTVTDFDEHESYYFVVRAVDEDGNESGDSNEVYWSPSGETNNSLSGNADGGSGGGGGCFIETSFGN